MMKFLYRYRETVGVVLGFVLLVMPVIALGAGKEILPSGGVERTAGGGTPSSFGLENPLKVNSICQLVQALLNAALAIGIPIAVLFVVWAGFRFILARGNPTELTNARKNFLWTLVGIGIFVGASLIATIIVNTLKQLGVSGVSGC